MIASTKGNRFRATLFLKETTKIDSKALVKRIERTFPEFKGKLIDLGPFQDMITYGIQMRDVTITVSVKNAPGPSERFNAAAASAGAWPNATREIAAHKAVVEVSHYRDAEGLSEVIKAAKVVSLISLTLAEVLPTIGLHWATSDAMLPTRLLSELEDDDLPMSLWFRLFWFHETADPAQAALPLTGVTVRGLEPFLGWELEVLPSAHDALILEDAISKLCRSVLGPGGSLLQYVGQTIPLTEAIKMPLRHGLSRNIPNLPVLQLGELPDEQRGADERNVMPWRRFGPDATFSGIAKWLNDNVEVIDAVFSMPEVTHIRLADHMTRQHPHVEHERTTPVMQVLFATGLHDTYRTSDLRAFESKSREILIRFERALGENAALLKRHCILREEVFYNEELSLTIWQGGVVTGMVRYHGIGWYQKPPEYELAGQYFTWIRRGDGYVPETLEIRLWGVYIPDFIREGQEALLAIAGDPKSLLDSPEILPGRETGYVALYQMQRPPTRVEWSREYISAFYDGENPEVPPLLADPA
jgi:hypothetical protein